MAALLHSSIVSNATFLVNVSHDYKWLTHNSVNRLLSANISNIGKEILHIRFNRKSWRPPQFITYWVLANSQTRWPGMTCVFVKGNERSLCLRVKLPCSPLAVNPGPLRASSWSFNKQPDGVAAETRLTTGYVWHKEPARGPCPSTRNFITPKAPQGERVEFWLFLLITKTQSREGLKVVKSLEFRLTNPDILVGDSYEGTRYWGWQRLIN